MEIIKKAADMQAWSDTVRQSKKRICLVPTMGYFHEGHLSLIDRGRKTGGEVVVSLFVNPAQFGENEDLDAYPSNVERDLSLARERGATAVFLPAVDEIYPPGYQTYVTLSHLPRHLCGLSRPVHFRGVATVVTKLFNIVKPHAAVFGAKDFQQVCIIRQMCADLNYNIEILAAPIVREKDGLAMSSRNAYLEPSQRPAALSLSRSLALAEKMVAEGETTCRVVKRAMEGYIQGFSGAVIDYISLCDPNTLEEVVSIDRPVLAALAVKVGKTRLIDNRIIDPAGER
ncbi:MAG: pantoate--beta-alanine ligase [Desulfobacteraceae bacterium]